MTVRAGLLGCIACTLALAAADGAQTGSAIDLDQNWNATQKDKFWFTPQGSLLLPYAWFLYLKQADSDTIPFRDPDNIRRLGYIPTTQKTELNKDLLPIGFARDRDGDGNSFVGFTCAACHTSALRIGTTEVIVEGAPALSDFWLFLNGLVKALDATATSTAKFDAFAKDVLGSSHTQEQERELKYQLENRRAELRRRWLQLEPETAYGPARLDAFGGLYNQVTAYHLRVPQNARVPDAPVSYPFLWDTPQHDKVQWNGTGDNGLAGLGPVFRNIGEALGVFGMVEIEKGNIPKYRSSLKVDNLKALEDLVRELRSPVWPGSPPAPDLVRKGAIVYDLFCSSCHVLLDRSDPKRKIKAKMIDVRTVGTDPRFAVNFAERFSDPDGVKTGVLEGAPKLLTPVPKFGRCASGADIFANVILGAYRGRHLQKRSVESAVSDDDTISVAAIRKISAALKKPKIVAEYKARPLNGIWATAPYLHNGSVPSVAELLKPSADRRKTFWIGSHEVDEINVGLSAAYVKNAFLFDTSKPGNSNEGHEYGTTLSEDHKKALLAFLKTL